MQATDSFGPAVPVPGVLNAHYIFRQGAIASQLCAALPSLVIDKTQMLNGAEGGC